jgi:ribosomal protein L7/L12
MENLPFYIGAAAALAALVRMLTGLGTTRAELRRLERKIDVIAEQLGIQEAVSPRPSDRVLTHLSAGQTIDAIRVYREENPGVGLADAKAAVEEIRRKQGLR